jgi:hypothetical protein
MTIQTAVSPSQKNGTRARPNRAMRARPPPVASTMRFRWPRVSTSFAPGKKASAAERLLSAAMRPTSEVPAPNAMT